MDTSHTQRNGIVPLAISFALVFGLLSLLGLTDPFSFWLRPVLARTLGLVGLEVINHPDLLQVGHLMIPWTRDCAGVNLVLFLWALLLWGNRGHYDKAAFWMRMLLAIIVGAAVNFIRILLLVAYRWIAYPSTETPEQHYLLGFLLLLPLLPILLGRRRGQTGWMSVLDAVYLMAVLALAATTIGSPGGYLVLMASLILLIEFRPFRYGSRFHSSLGLLWLLSGAAIGVSGMESLWIAFLLLCPYAYTAERWRSPLTWLALPATLPIVAMHPVAGWVFAGLSLAKAIEVLRRPVTSVPSSLALGRPFLRRAMLVSGLMLPFLMPAFSWRNDARWSPPGGSEVTRIDPLSLRVRLLAQSPELELYAYLPGGDGRHHSVETCMLYRGVRLKSAGGGVLTDGEALMKQYFLINGEVTEDYRAYIMRTFVPFSSAGVHLIAVTPAGSTEATAFERAADRLALRLLNPGHSGN